MAQAFVVILRSFEAADTVVAVFTQQHHADNLARQRNTRIDILKGLELAASRLRDQWLLENPQPSDEAPQEKRNGWQEAYDGERYGIDLLLKLEQEYDRAGFSPNDYDPVFIVECAKLDPDL